MTNLPHDIMLIQADARHIPLADETVDCVVTSPPYYGLRDYGVADQIGLEKAFDCMGWATGESCGTCFICQLRAVFREVKRVLKPHGTAWVNMGDSYNSAKLGAMNGIGAAYGKTPDKPGHNRPCRVATGLKTRPLNDLKHKDLMCQPWRLGLALQVDGWWLRSEVIWHKSNPMPESAQDRLSKAHETILLLTKSERYFFDRVAISTPTEKLLPKSSGQHLPGAQQQGKTRSFQMPDKWTTGMSPARTVWTMATQPRPEAHFATFPERLAERCILAGTSAKGVCPACGQPWVRVTKKSFTPQPDVSAEKAIRAAGNQKPMDSSSSWGGSPRGTTAVSTVTWEPGCDCGRDPVPAVVLDPFIGSGTTCRVAVRLRRRAIGLDLSHAYLHDIATPFLSRPLQVELGLEVA